MNFEEFVKENPWKEKILGLEKASVVNMLGESTDQGAGKSKNQLFRFGDIEVGFTDTGMAFYVQIDFGLGYAAKGSSLYTLQSWPIRGGAELTELAAILKQYSCEFSVVQSNLNPDVEEIHTFSGLIFSFVKPSAEFYGKGLVNVRTST